MSKPHAGTYYIINRVSAPDRKSLALTFNGENATVSVTPFAKKSNQKWVIHDYTDGKTQSVSPKDSSSLQIGMGNGVLRVLAPGGYVWTIRVDHDGVATMQDGGCTVYWGLHKAVSNAEVVFGKGTGDEKQCWVLEHVTVAPKAVHESS